jgi:hypothetical protein
MPHGFILGACSLLTADRFGTAAQSARAIDLVVRALGFWRANAAKMGGMRDE